MIEAMRKREPLETVTIPRVIAVAIAPSQIDAPDIVKIIVERDGAVVAPLGSTLAPRSFQTRIGATKMLHAGMVMYPCASFAPAAVVTVTAIPEFGSNIVKKFTSAELVNLK